MHVLIDAGLEKLMDEQNADLNNLIISEWLDFEISEGMREGFFDKKWWDKL